MVALLAVLRFDSFVRCIALHTHKKIRASRHDLSHKRAEKYINDMCVHSDVNQICLLRLGISVTVHVGNVLFTSKHKYKRNRNLYTGYVACIIPIIYLIHAYVTISCLTCWYVIFCINFWFSVMVQINHCFVCKNSQVKIERKPPNKVCYNKCNYNFF